MRHRLVTVLSLAALVGAGIFGSAARAQEAAGQETKASQQEATAAAPAPGITVTGSVETYFTYNFIRPPDKRNFFIYNNRHSEFGIN